MRALRALVNFVHLNFVDNLPSGFSYICCECDMPVGKVHVTLKNNVATIADIIVNQRNIPRVPCIPFLRRTVSYRNRGYGSALLNIAIDKCRALGVTRIMGNMHGDIERLSGWYSKNGFDVVGNDICMYL